MREEYRRAIDDILLYAASRVEEQVRALVAGEASRFPWSGAEEKAALTRLRSGPLGTELATIAAIAEGEAWALQDTEHARRTIRTVYRRLFLPVTGTLAGTTPYQVPIDFYDSPLGLGQMLNEARLRVMSAADLLSIKETLAELTAQFNTLGLPGIHPPQLYALIDAGRLHPIVTLKGKKYRELQFDRREIEEEVERRRAELQEKSVDRE